MNTCFQFYAACSSVGYLTLLMSTTEEKLDSLLKAVSDLSNSQQDNQCDLDAKLKKLEKDVAAAQQDETERALRKAKRGRLMEFRRKGHQEQFEFNEQVEDHLEAASKKIKKIADPADSDSKKFLKEALEELQEGVDVVAERQKHIQIADQSEYHWRTVEAYKVGALGDSDDAKKIKEAERDVAHQLSREKKKPNREGRPPPPVFHQWVPAVPQPQQMLLPQQAPPRHQGFYKPPGPCFNCYQMGHIKANCPKLTRPQQYVVIII